MDDLGDELRKYAERLQQEKAESEKRAAERESQKRGSEEATARRVGSMADKYLNKARELSNKARLRIRLNLSPPQQDAFWLKIGKPTHGSRGIRATLSETGWRVKSEGSRGHIPDSHYRDDAACEAATEQLLGPLMKQAIEGLINENEEMSPDR